MNNFVDTSKGHTIIIGGVVKHVSHEQLKRILNNEIPSTEVDYFKITKEVCGAS